MLIDGLMLKLYNLPYDEDGKVAAKGKVSFELLENSEKPNYLLNQLFITI